MFKIFKESKSSSVLVTRTAELPVIPAADKGKRKLWLGLVQAMVYAQEEPTLNRQLIFGLLQPLSCFIRSVFIDPRHETQQYDNPKSERLPLERYPP